MISLTLVIVKYADRVLSSLHRSAAKGISLVMGAIAQVQNVNLSEWARRLQLYQPGKAGSRRAYSFKYKKYRIWRFLTRSVFKAKEVWMAVSEHLLDPRDVPENRGPILVTLDWTKLGKTFWALVLALPYHGRALPLTAEVLAEEFLKNEMTHFEIDFVRMFLRGLSPGLRSRIVILADRGFAKVELFKAIEEAGASYVIRLHRDSHVRRGSDWVELRHLPVEAGETHLHPATTYTHEHEKKVNLLIRRLPMGMANNPEDDTWYLATNRDELSRVADWYSKRFKEEEMFKDWKSMLHLDEHRIKSEEGTNRLVAIVGLYYVFVILEGQARTTPERLRQVTQDRKGVPELGIFRQAQAVLFLCALEAATPPWDLIMTFWVQVH